MTAPQRREGVEGLKSQGVSERRACDLACTSRSVARYRPVRRNEDELVERIKSLAGLNPRYGCPRIWALLKREGRAVNRKRVHRLWRKLKLQVPRRRRKKRYASGGQVPLRAQHPNHVWTWDFIYDTTADGRTLRSLTVSDEFTREGLAIQTGRRFPARRAVEVLERLVAAHGAPEHLRSDNGPEFIARLMKRYLEGRGIGARYIEPGSPWQNAYGESFNGKFRDECLNLEVYSTEAEAQVVHECWRRHFNTERPHSSLDYRTPLEFKAQWTAERAGGGSGPGREASLPHTGPDMRRTGGALRPRPHARSPAAALGFLSRRALSSAQAVDTVAGGR